MHHAGRPASTLTALALAACLCLAAGCSRGSARAASALAPAPDAPALAPAAPPPSPAAGAAPPPEAVASLPEASFSDVASPQDAAAPVPILMYHVIATAPRGAAYAGLYVAPADFGRQMEWLAANGYHAVTLGALWDHWGKAAPLPSRPVVVSFDDGYRSVATAALPEMRRLGFPGTLNLQVGMLGQAGGLTPDMVRGLIAAGWEVDAHSITHPDLTRVGAAQLRHEVADSRVQLQQLFGAPVRFFCYPSGRHDARVIDAVQAAGYLAATTTHPGLATPRSPYALNRIRVSGGEALAAFARSVQGLP